MLVQDPLSKYPRLGKYALIFSIIPGYFHEYDAEEVIQQAVNSQSVHGFLSLTPKSLGLQSAFGFN